MRQPPRLLQTRIITLVAPLVLLAACGVDAVGTAATVATVKKQEVEQAQAQGQAVQQQLQQALQQNQQRQQAFDDASK